MVYLAGRGGGRTLEDSFAVFAVSLIKLIGKLKLSAVQREGVCTRMTSTTHWRQFIDEENTNA